jgi:iron complex transport system substrate-binding protein
VVAVLAVAGLALSAGCAGPGVADSDGAAGAAGTIPLEQVRAVDDPKGWEGPSTAVLADRSVEPVVEDPEQTLPATVVSHDRAGEREVEVTDTDRVLALDISGTLAATVWGLGLGDRLVGRDVSTTFPGTEDLPVVTSDGHSLNAEAVLRSRPTLVVTDGSIGPRDVVEQLRDAGVTVVFVENQASFDGAQDLARDVAAALGVPAAGERLAERIAAQLDDVRAQVDRLAPAAVEDRLSMVFLYLRGSAGVYYLLGEDSGAGDLVRGLGGVDVAAELGWKDMQPLTDEAVLAADPDLVIVMSHGLESVGGVDALLADKTTLALTAAGRNRRFVDMADGDVLSFGPRSAGVLDALARAVYAPRGPA